MVYFKQTITIITAINTCTIIITIVTVTTINTNHNKSSMYNINLPQPIINARCPWLLVSVVISNKLYCDNIYNNLLLSLSVYSVGDGDDNITSVDEDTLDIMVVEKDSPDTCLLVNFVA